jgi:hypothetical protein
MHAQEKRRPSHISTNHRATNTTTVQFQNQHASWNTLIFVFIVFLKKLKEYIYSYIQENIISTLAFPSYTVNVFLIHSSIVMILLLLFVQNLKGYRLNTTVIKYVHAYTGVECVLLCLNEDTSCRSINFRKTSNSDKNCELLRDVHSEKSDLLLKDDQFDHYQLLDANRVSINRSHIFFIFAFCAYIKTHYAQRNHAVCISDTEIMLIYITFKLLHKIKENFSPNIIHVNYKLQSLIGNS